jgi:hypothetical protein
VDNWADPVENLIIAYMTMNYAIITDTNAIGYAHFPLRWHKDAAILDGPPFDIHSGKST